MNSWIFKLSIFESPKSKLSIVSGILIEHIPSNSSLPAAASQIRKPPDLISCCSAFQKLACSPYMMQNKEKVNKIFCKIKKSRNNILQSPENRIFLRETFSSLGKLRYFISEALGKVHIALLLENRSVLVF